MSKLKFEKITDTKLDRQVRVLFILDAIKDLLIAALVVLGIIKLIGG